VCDPGTVSKIDRLILIDREVDMVTPMVTQITYEGLIDEVTGIKCGSVAWQPRGVLAPRMQLQHVSDRTQAPPCHTF
jgi:vacuolar protein sorting-associated protein 33A